LNLGKVNGNMASNGGNLPHKLRHKLNLGEKDLPPYGFVGHTLKSDIQVSPLGNTWDHDDSCGSASGSSDERDSGISINGEGGTDKFGRQHSPVTGYKMGPTVNGVDVSNESSQGPQRKRAKKRFTEESVLETENVQLKSELARLATEVACLKSFLVKKKPTGTSSGDATHDENSCDSS
jgi:hypothetical protein